MSFNFRVDLKSKLTLRQNENLRLDDIKIFSCCSKIFLHFRYGKKLLCFQLLENSLSKVWEIDIFNSDIEHDKTKYPWFITDKLKLGDYQILVRTESDLKVIKVSNIKATIIATDGILHDVYGCSLQGREVKIGNIFPNLEKVGFITRDANNSTIFYATDRSIILKKPKNALLRFRKELQILSDSPWKNYKNVHLFDIQNSGQDTIILRTLSGFEFYSFNAEYNLLKFSTLNFAYNENEKILFGNLTDSKNCDLLILNHNGLFVYQWNEINSSYEYISFYSQFSIQNGWELNLYGEFLHLFDLNQDQRDEFVVSDQFGINAYSFLENDRKWVDSVLHTNDNDIKFSNIIAVIKNATTNEIACVTKDLKDDVSLLKISTIAKEDTNENSTQNEAKKIHNWYDMPENNSWAIPRHEQFFDTDAKPILRWVQKYDTTVIFKDVVNPITGNVKFSLPLVNLPYDLAQTIDYHIWYDSSGSGDKLLGMGWSTNIRVEFISVNYGGSIFESDHIYVLNINGESITLDFINQNESMYQFNIRTEPQIQSITYDKNREEWKIITEEEIKTYGGKFKGNSCQCQYLHHSLAWENWQGAGTHTDSLKQNVIGWYLREKHATFQRNSLYYCYKSIEKLIHRNKKFTSEVVLEKVHNNKDTFLTFTYREKGKKEYVEPAFTDNYGKYRFPTAPASTLFLDGYCVITENYSQCMRFTYRINNNIRLLTDIEQIHENVVLEKITKYNYKWQYGTHLMTEIHLPTDLILKLEYKEIFMTRSNLNNVIKYPVLEKPQFTEGSNFIVMSDRLDFNKSIRIRFLDKIYKFLIFETVLKINVYIRHFYQIVSDENLMLIAHTTESIKTFVLEKDKNIWTIRNHNETYNADSLTTISNSIFALSEPGKNMLTILKCCPENNSFKEYHIIISKICRLDSNNDKIAAYNDNDLFFIYEENKQWKYSILDFNAKAYFKSSRDILNNFDIKENIKDDIILNFVSCDFHVIGNIIFVSKLQIENDVFSKRLDILMLDAKFKVYKSQVINIGSENLLNIINENIIDDISFGYVKESHRYKIKIKDIKGKYVEEVNKIRNKNRRHDEKENVKNIMENEIKSKYHELILMDMSKYVTQLTQMGILIGTDKSFLVYNGLEYIYTKFPKYFTKLNNDVTLEEIKPTLLNIIRNVNNTRNVIRQIPLKMDNLILNRYPIFIAYQNMNNDLQLLSFNKDVEIIYDDVFSGEVFLFESDYSSLISFANLSQPYHSEPYSIQIRNSYSFLNIPSTIFVSSLEYTDNISPRMLSFERQYIIDENFNTKIEVEMIPEGGKNISGYTKSVWFREKFSNDWSCTVLFFNSNGELEREGKQQKMKSKNHDIDAEVDTVIMDKNKRLILLDTKPYNASIESIRFISFEDYELYERSDSWNFNIKDIVRNNYSYTGNNILRLRNATLNSKILPTNQEGIYYVSAFLRSIKPLLVGDSTVILKAEVLYNLTDNLVTLASKVIKQYGQWALVQAEINFNKLNEIYRSYLDYIGNSAGKNIPRIAINIVIQPVENEELDVDNIAFYPEDFDFRAYVYHPTTGFLSSVIRYKDSVSRNIYDYYGNEIIVLKDDGSEIKLTMLHLTGKTNNVVNGKPHTTLFISSNGFYEIFDEYAFKTRWIVGSNSDWLRSYSSLKHIGNNIGYLELNKELLSPESYLVHFKYRMLQNSKLVLYMLAIERNREKTELRFSQTLTDINAVGFVTVNKMKNRIIVWHDNLIFVDQAVHMEFQSLKFVVTGEVFIENLCILNDPEIKIEYKNQWGEKQQIINYVQSEEIVRHEIIYDNQGRDAITTKLTIDSGPKHLLAYNATFTDISNEFWTNGIMNGDVRKLNPCDGDFPYSRKVYVKNTLNQVSVVGLPGSDSCISCPYNKKFYYKTNNSFVLNLYPRQEGYSVKEEEYSDGTKYINVYDNRNNLIALYVHVKNFDHYLSTYEYNSNNQLIKVLPPLYHELVKTPQKIDMRLDTINDIEIQSKIALINEYNVDGKLVKTKNSDTGDVEYLYNSSKQVNFMIHYKLNSSEINNVIIFQYDQSSQLVKTSYISKLISRDQIIMKNTLDHQELKDSEPYQTIFYDRYPTNKDSVLTKSFITQSENITVIDRIDYNSFDNIIEKQIQLFSPGKSYEFFFNKIQRNNYDHSIIFPFQYLGRKIQINFSYDKLGHLRTISLGKESKNFVTYRYTGGGQLQDETFFEGSNKKFNRKYKYNSASFLTEISDKFLSQSLTYTSNGYGQIGNGDGLVMSTHFNMTWTAYNDKRFMQLRESHSAKINHKSTCFTALKTLKYIDSNGTVLKKYYQSMK